MALPKLVTPKYKLKLPSNGKSIEYRPFLVKEEKVLLTAMEGFEGSDAEAVSHMKDTVNSVINNCTFDKVDSQNLPQFDVDFLFLNIRVRSKGEFVHPVYTCKNRKTPDDEPCGTDNKVEVDLSKVKVVFPKKDYTKVMVSDDVGIVFKYISSGDKQHHEMEPSETERYFRIIVDSIDYIFDKDKIYKGSETSKHELLEFLESMTEKPFEEVKKFFSNQPALRHVIKYKCSKCGYKEDIVIEGVESFFDLA